MPIYTIVQKKSKQTTKAMTSRDELTNLLREYKNKLQLQSQA